MPPKKKDRPPVEAPKPQQQQRPEQPQQHAYADHELFLQAFEKPTQIYRYLRTRHVASPIFLHRTLTYMSHRMSRNHKNRKNFKVDSLLQRVQAQQDPSSCRAPSQMTLTFTGFFDRSTKRDMVTAEAVILKICNKKKKELELPLAQLSAPFVYHVPVGSCEVPHNPEGAAHTSSTRTTAITVPGNSFCPNGTGLVRSYVLLLRVTAGGLVNEGDTGVPAVEPPSKKARRNGCHRPPTSGAGSGAGSGTSAEESRHYVGEMVVYEQQRCLLSEGEYQLMLRPWGPKAAPLARTASWESLNHIESSPPLEAFEKCPKVAFRLNWGPSEESANAECPDPVRTNRPVLSPVELNVAEPGHKHTRSRRNGEMKASQQQIQQQGSGQVQKIPNKAGTGQRTRVVYQFVYQQQTRQQTEARADMRCPWCLLQCRLLAALLKHLKLCHGRFTFSYVPHPKGARIDVSINECYDGSYSGNPQHLHTQTGYAFGWTGPARRTPVTCVMVCRPKRAPLSLAEFMEQDEPDIEQPRPYMSGHNRLYYHTETCLPIRPQEIERDSESEDDPEWLRIKTQMMIDEFTDVNEGEKELMKMWNLHVMRYGFVGDCQIALACNMFVEQKGHELIQRNLYRNFVLHMCNLLDYGLVSASVVYTTVRRLQMFCDVKDRRLRLPIAYS
ncbi:polycomb protein suz12 isoform X2 [Dermacentor andersoni]|uniref:polycomb protein suz12 isoform X2 n=1 Tax=Dermacentor andersoni TaxID=34620 RepID=UPI0021558D71|nr:polycomb protein suz12-like isoform X2 [Dermacentor andersoni]